MATQDIWVFGYGSLVWQPEFSYVDTAIARLDGYSRSFCMRSIHHRGTAEKNGLVLALDEDVDGYCDGVAFRIAAAKVDQTLTALRERELISSAYFETQLDVRLAAGARVQAYCYVIDPNHEQYCALELEEQAQIISTAVGGRGPNTEYLFNTAQHLKELGIADAELEWLVARVSEISS